MLLETKFVTVEKHIFTISKIDGYDYKCNIGNFAKALKKHNMTIDDYMNTYYRDYIPLCLETNQPSDNKVTGYWNGYIPLQKKFKKLKTDVKNTENIVKRIKQHEPEYYTDYLEYQYWFNLGYTLSAATQRIRYFVADNRDILLYQRLSDHYYDNSWSLSKKDEYINSILSMNALPLYNKWSTKGIEQRGNISADDVHQFYKHRPTVFRDSDRQQENNKKKLAKYNKEQLRKFSVRCVEYWLHRGYNMDEAIRHVSLIQTTNSINTIKSRFECTETEARDIQSDIYDRRLKTMRLKSNDELIDIYKRQDSGSFEYCLRKCNYNRFDALILFDKLKMSRIVPFGRASKESLKYFIPLYKTLRKHGVDRSDIYIGMSGSKEYWLRNIDKKLFFTYDFTILSKKLIIEYDGVHWHKNPEKDKIKTQLAIDNGFKLLRIDSELTDELKFSKINKFINNEMQIKNPDWRII